MPDGRATRALGCQASPGAPALATSLERARPQPGDDRLLRLVAGIKAAAPERTLQQIAAQLEAMHERTPRGGTRWHPSSVKHLLEQAGRRGLARKDAG